MGHPPQEHHRVRVCGGVEEREEKRGGCGKNEPMSQHLKNHRSWIHKKTVLIHLFLLHYQGYVCQDVALPQHGGGDAQVVGELMPLQGHRATCIKN